MVIWLLFICAKASYIRYFIVNLDEEPQERWREVIESKLTELRAFSESLDEYFSPFFLSVAEKVLLETNVPEDYIEEMKGISKIANIELSRILVANFLYDVYAGCTSIVARNIHDEIFLARNLDYFFQPSLMRNMTVQVSFYANSNLVFQSVTFAGYIGVPTAIKPGKYGLALNERRYNSSLIFKVLKILGGYGSVPMEMRRALETFDDYEDAKRHIESVNVMSTAYIIMAGLDQACVITKNNAYVSDVMELKDQWFILETNYDHWLPVPEKDDRRGSATKLMEQMGQDFAQEELLQVMSNPPILNEITIHTTIIAPSQRYISTIVR